MSEPKLAANPSLHEIVAVRALAEDWQLTASVRDLGSTQDQNFRVDTADGRRFVLKISNRLVGLTAHNAALSALVGRDLADLDVPAVVPAADGREIVVRDRYFLTLLDWVAGVPMADRPFHSWADRVALGRAAATLSGALAGLDHPGLDRIGEWNARVSLDVLAELADEIADPAVRRLVEAGRGALQNLAARGAGLDALPLVIAHGDVSDLNTVCRPDRPGAVPVGVIDFGDVMRTWRPADAAAIVVGLAGHPSSTQALDTAQAVLAGYHAVQPFGPAEATAYWPLILARAGLCLAVSALQAQTSSERSAYLERALALDQRAAETLFAVDSQLATALALVTTGHEADRPARAVVARLASAPRHRLVDAPLRPIDLSADADLFAFGEWLEPAPLVARIDDGQVGRWGECRLVGAGAPATDAPANASLGADVFLTEGAVVYAPVAGRVESVADDPSGRPALVVRPALAPEARLRLSGLVPAGLAVGAEVAPGQVLGQVVGPVGGRAVLRVQLSLVPGQPDWTAARWLVAAAALNPDPSVLLGVNVAAPPSASEQLRRAHDQVVAAPQHLYYDAAPEIVRGWRHILYDSTGRPRLDMVNNIASVGHSHPRVAVAAARQFRRLNTNSRFLYESMTRYCERIAALLPAGLDRVFLVNSGSEAADLALQLAQVFTGRRDLIALQGGYHGWTGAVLDLCTSDMDRPQWRSDRPDHVHPVPQPDAYRGVFGADGPRYADAVARACADAASRGTPVAAFISEPLLGNQGGIEAAPGFLAAAYEAVREAGGLCIADEVQVGLGRTGETFWAFEHEGTVPDILITAKSTGNGHPLGVVVCRPDIAAAFDARNSYFSSTGGGPVSSELGLAVLDVLAEEDLPGNARVVGGQLKDRLHALADRHRAIGAVHGRGLFLGVDLVSETATKTPDPLLAKAVCDRLLDLGVILQPTGDAYNLLKIKPPLCIDAASAEFFVAALDRALGEVASAEMGPGSA
jgi:4-aminobutyrate aminotransferase-like enzyme/Ser/Thr protein kinase RdoA (MazF antagonist)